VRRLIDVAEAVVNRRDAQPVVARQRRVARTRCQLSVEGDEIALRARPACDLLDLVPRAGERRVVAEGGGENGSRIVAASARRSPPSIDSSASLAPS